MEQLSFFDQEPEEPVKVQENDDSYLDEWALVYLVTRSGGTQGNLWVLKTEDAKKLCSDECSHGQARGGHWMFQWTTIRHFVHQNDQYDKRLEDFLFIFDTGKQNKDFKRLGIEKPTLAEQFDLIRRLGYNPTTHSKYKQELIREGEEMIREMKKGRKK